MPESDANESTQIRTRRKTTKIILSSENEVLRRRLLGWQSVGALATRCGSGTPFAVIVNEAVRDCSQVFAADMVCVLTLGAGTMQLEVAASIGLDSGILNPIPVENVNDLEGAARKGLPGWALHDPFAGGEDADAYRFDDDHSIFVTLQYQGTPMGVLCICRPLGLPVFDGEDGRVAQSIASQISLVAFLEGPARLMLDRERAEKDMQFAHALKGKILPARAPVSDRLRVGARALKSLDGGGDFHDFIPLPGDRLVATAGEISGRGVQAALNLAKVVQMLRGVFANGVECSQALKQLNDSVIAEGLRGNMLSLCLLGLNPEQGAACFARAGSTQAYVRERGEFRRLESGGAPLGVLAGCDYGIEQVRLEEGTAFVFATDGLNKCHDVNGAVFTGERFEAVLQECARRCDGRAPLAYCIADHIAEQAHQDILTDDVTVLTVEILA